MSGKASGYGQPMLKATLEALLPAVCIAASSPPAFAQWDNAIGVAARQFTVTEYDARGRRIVREQGWLPGLEGRLAYKADRWVLFGEGEHYESGIDYHGQTQRGAPVESRTETELMQLRAGAAYAVNDNVSAFAALEWERWKRDIRGVQAVRGLQERTTSQRLLLGLDSRYWIARYGQASANAALVLARPEKLRVGFSGVLDDASLETRSATGLRFGFGLRPAAWRNVELRASADWLKVGRSDDAPVARNGVFAGTIAQPEHVKRAFTLGLRYWF
jgi:opacity protein-like surface antigen